MELNRLTADKEDSTDWKENKKRRANSDPSPYKPLKPEGDPRERTPLRSPKPPLEMTAADKRIANGEVAFSVVFPSPLLPKHYVPQRRNSAPEEVTIHGTPGRCYEAERIRQ